MYVIKVSVNGGHFSDYNHRAAFQQITTIGFFGEFQIQQVSFQQDPSMVRYFRIQSTCHV